MMSKTEPVPIRVMIADDSPSARAFLVSILELEDGIEVVGEAQNGEQAVDGATKLRPDVILMDGHMPDVDGFTATRRIMETCPTRIIIATASYDPRDVKTSLQGLEAGALSVVEKPFGPGDPRHEASVKQLLSLIRALSEVGVVRRWARRSPETGAPPDPPKNSLIRPRIIAIAGSTGAPKVLASILRALPPDIACPVVLVQHISAGFVEGFAMWLDGLCRLPVLIARNGDALKPANVYVAPENRHLRVAADDRIALGDDPPVGNFRPSADCLFESVARSYGAAAIGVILTGMGRDGADGLTAMARAGAVTVAQDPATCVIRSMPSAAIAAGAIHHVIPAEAIGDFLTTLVTPARVPGL